MQKRNAININIIFEIIFEISFLMIAGIFLLWFILKLAFN